MRKLLSLMAIAITTMAQGAPEPVPPRTYRLVDLGPSSDVTLLDINNKGQLVGTRVSGGPFVYDGSFKNLGFRGVPSSINDDGAIVGSYCPDSTCVESRAFLIDKHGEFTDLIPGVQSFARKINDKGEIIGVASFPGTSNPKRGFIWRDGAIEYLEAEPLDINRRGHFVARSFDGPRQSFFYAGGQSTALPFDAVALNDSDVIVGGIRQVLPPGYFQALDVYTWTDGVVWQMPGEWEGINWSVADINNRDEILGDTWLGHHWPTDLLPFNPVLWRRGQNQLLTNMLRPSDYAQWILSGASRINDKDEILGGAYTRTSFQHRVVLLQPIDEDEQ